MCESGESNAASVGVRMISAPNARSTSTFSFDIFSGSVMIMRYPRTAAVNAIPIPVFPLVGSISVSPGLMRPLFSASRIMRLPIRSFTLPPALKYSHLASISHSMPSAFGIAFRRTSGVLPMKSRIESPIFGGATDGMCTCGDCEGKQEKAMAESERDGSRVDHTHTSAAVAACTGGCRAWCSRLVRSSQFSSLVLCVVRPVG